jgi:hypothetical protein
VIGINAQACAMIIDMLSLDETAFALHVKSPAVELDNDDLDCCNSCITLLIRLQIRRKRTEPLRRRHSI